MKAVFIVMLSMLLATTTRSGFSREIEASDNLSAAFGWHVAVDTDLSFSEFYDRNYTIAARFMIQYARSYEAPILAANGAGGFLVAVAGYGEGRSKAERLLVVTGGKKRFYTVAGKLQAERWHWLALVREGSVTLLYLDGEPVEPDDSDAEIVKEESPKGTLAFGRKASGDAQFYGFIDDVAVFDSALSRKTLLAYYQESSRLKGTEAGLIAAYLFDRKPDTLPATRASQRRTYFTQPAAVIEVSTTRDNAADALRLPAPFNSTRMMLPLPAGQSWKVIQGYGQALSHNGGGCFSWDFARVDGPGAEQPVYAAASGRVVAVSDNNDPEPSDRISKDNFNYMQMETAPGELLTYLHMKNGSLVEALSRFATPSFPKLFAPFSVEAGAEVGRVGNTWTKERPDNWHLHFASVPYANSPVSIPLAFSDYEVYEPQTKSWRKVVRGVPRQGEIVRRAN
jgi:murein DD-endopeptidase MepM/ murein hydrolase activator NlpD